MQTITVIINQIALFKCACIFKQMQCAYKGDSCGTKLGEVSVAALHVVGHVGPRSESYGVLGENDQENVNNSGTASKSRCFAVMQESARAAAARVLQVSLSVWDVSTGSLGTSQVV